MPIPKGDRVGAHVSLMPIWDDASVSPEQQERTLIQFFQLAVHDGGNFYRISKPFLHVLKPLESISLSALINWYCKLPPNILMKRDGWFFFTIRDFEAETGFNQDQQDRIFKSLEELDLIERKRMGMPPKRYFRLKTKVVQALWEKGMVKILKYRSDKQLDRATGLDEKAEIRYQTGCGRAPLVDPDDDEFY